MDEKELEFTILYRSITPDIFTKGGEEMSPEELKVVEESAKLQKEIYG